MGKKLWGIVAVVFASALIGGCGGTKNSGEEVAISNFDQSFMTQEGYYFIDEEGMLHFFDKKSGKTVIVCDRADCDHQPGEYAGASECNAELYAEEMAVYGDKIYYISMSDTINELEVRCRDKDGNNDGKIASVEGQYTRDSAWFYENTVMFTAEVIYPESFDAETKQSSKDSVMRLYAVDLSTGKAQIVKESSLTEHDQALYVHKAEDGKFYFYDWEEGNFYTYSIETGSLEQREVKCAMEFGSIIIMGDYCYGAVPNRDGYDFVRENIETGEDEVYYTGASYQDAIYYSSGVCCFYNMDDPDHFCYYDTRTGKLTEMPGSYPTKIGVGAPTLISDEGVIFFTGVHMTDRMQSYSGDFEYQYMTLKDFLDGGDNYVPVYYLDQESGQ